jgi:hypothetical protein
MLFVLFVMFVMKMMLLFVSIKNNNGFICAHFKDKILTRTVVLMLDELNNPIVVD